MIDAGNTTLEWQTHRTDILVLPVGSMEQHGSHLPLNTDQTVAEYTARIVAEHFDAALLPCIAVANSLEHTGFRGSFSLRPETLMQIIRDIADEAESQGFRFLIVVNSHGGNFALGPVCRDINRADRRIKLILHQAFSYADPSRLEAIRQGKMDIHAGEAETSVLMAIKQKKRDTAPCGGNEGSFRQANLDTFGIGYLNGSGVLGHPELASIEKGIHLCETMGKQMFEDLERQIGHLRKHNSYAGPGGLAVRDADICDLEELSDLSTRIKWNQTDAEWRMFIQHGTVLSMLRQGRIVGTAAAMGWEKQLAWIGLVITAPEMRGYGVASRLMKELLDRFKDHRTIKLDASQAGAEVYGKLGFVPENKIIRLSMSEPLADLPDTGMEWSAITEKDIPELALRESEFTGVVRSQLWNFYIGNWPEMTLVARRNGKIEAYLLRRPGRLFRQAGALGASTCGNALAALRRWAALEPQQPFQIDVPETQSEFLDALYRLGFHKEREFLRMRYGDECGDWGNHGLYAIFGPEMG